MHRMKQSILVFHIGQLGDTIVALPALWALRDHYREARLTLLSDQHPTKRYVAGADLLEGTRLVDDFEFYPVQGNLFGKLMRPVRMARLLAKLRRRRFDALAYLLPSTRNRAQVDRDRRFFKLAGIRRFVGMEGFTQRPKRIPDQPLEMLPFEADQLLDRLAASGIPTPPPGRGCMDLKVGSDEQEIVSHWCSSLPSHGARLWIGVGPGTKMPSKKWPAERFEQAVSELIRRFDVWPVVFGGPEDREVGDRLLGAWHRGYNAAGALGLRPAVAALSRCVLYLGNDTGTMHMAASSKVPCVAVFSARDWPGKWNPYGTEHQILRASIDCEGCGLTVCIDRQNECLKRISITAVVDACCAVLNEKSRARGKHDPVLSQAF